MKKGVNKKLDDFRKIHSAAVKSNDGKRCMIAPHPDLKKEIKKELMIIQKEPKNRIFANKLKVQENSRPGFNDGLIYPGNTYPLGTSASAVQNARIMRAPLRGNVRVIVVLVDFSDKPMTKPKSYFENLFFSTGVIATGSVKEYYKEVTNNLVDIQGQVVGPYRLPKTLSQYAHGESGTGLATPNARTMAKDAAVKSNPSVNFALYDNDHDNYVDAFVVVHAGKGAEVTGNPGDIWSHKWVLPAEYLADGSTKIYSYLTVPEDCNLGVCAHELGHLLFLFPDLYDTDYSSEGIGDWCLMAGGSWNNGGLTPAHPSAWCKGNQGWVTVETPTSNRTGVIIKDVKTDKKVLKLWKNGVAGKEYFLLENRQKTKFDKNLPGDGLLIWHIDDNIDGNSNEAHYQVALMQSDGLRNLELGVNQGDDKDPYPGTLNKKTFNKTSAPNSKSYGGVDTLVSVTNIKKIGSDIKADIKVKP